MQVTLDLPDEFAKEIFADISPAYQGDFLVNKILKNINIFKKSTKVNSSDTLEDDFIFTLIPQNGTVVTNEMVNHIREQEGI